MITLFLIQVAVVIVATRITVHNNRRSLTS